MYAVVVVGIVLRVQVVRDSMYHALQREANKVKGGIHLRRQESISRAMSIMTRSPKLYVSPYVLLVVLIIGVLTCI